MTASNYTVGRPICDPLYIYTSGLWWLTFYIQLFGRSSKKWFGTNLGGIADHHYHGRNGVTKIEVSTCGKAKVWLPFHACLKWNDGFNRCCQKLARSKICRNCWCLKAVTFEEMQIFKFASKPCGDTDPSCWFAFWYRWKVLDQLFSPPRTIASLHVWQKMGAFSQNLGVKGASVNAPFCALNEIGRLCEGVEILFTGFFITVSYRLAKNRVFRGGGSQIFSFYSKEV